MSHSAPGARSSSRRVDTTTVLALLLPLATMGALLLVQPVDEQAPAHPPSATALTSASVVCPSALPGAGSAYLTSAAGEGVEGEALLGAEQRPVPLASGRVAEHRERGPLAVTGEGALAPGLLAARLEADPLAALTCPSPTPEAWFTGVGAGAGHTSVLELVNPDSGPAVADVTVYGRSGVVDVPDLRGVSVPGHSSVRLDLASVVPRRDELALRLVTSRGRLAPTLLDSYDELGAGASSHDWLAAQPAPSTANLLLGLARGAGKRTLVLANPGDDEVRATVRFVTEDSVFVPEGVREIRLAPQSVERISLNDQLRSGVSEGVAGVLVDSTGPVTSTLRSFVGGDLSHATSGTPVTSSTSVLLPVGAKQLVLAGAEVSGTAEVVSRSADGRELDRARVELRPGRGTVLVLPRRAALVTVEPRGTPVTGAVLVTGDGAAVVALIELVREALVPQVRPGLP